MTYSAEAYYRDDEPTIVSTAGDMDALIDAVTAESFQNSIAALCIRERPLSDAGLPDHELEVAVNAEAKVGGLRYAGPHLGVSGVWYAAGQTSDRDEVFYSHTGNDSIYPQDSEISLELLRQAAEEFLTGGGERPTAVQWKPWPENLH